MQFLRKIKSFKTLLFLNLLSSIIEIEEKHDTIKDYNMLIHISNILILSYIG